MMVVLALLPKEFYRMCVSLEPLYGMCAFLNLLSLRITVPKVSKLRFMWQPFFNLVPSDNIWEARSLPARSTKLIVAARLLEFSAPTNLGAELLIVNQRIGWDLELVSFKAVFPICLWASHMGSVDARSTGSDASPFFLAKDDRTRCFSLLSCKRCPDRLFGHTIRSSSQIIKVNLRGCLLLGAKNESLLRVYARTLILSWKRAFIVFGTVSHLCWDGFLTFVVMMTTQLVTEQSSPFRWLIGIASGGDLMIHLSSQSAGGMVQCVASCLGRQSDVPSSMLLA